MKDGIIEIFTPGAAAGERFLNETGHSAHGKERDASAIHMEVIIRAPVSTHVFFLLDRHMLRHRAAAARRGDDLIVARTVCPKNKGIQVFALARHAFQERSRRTVAKERADDAVFLCAVL